jgi:hypothetical protein
VKDAEAVEKVTAFIISKIGADKMISYTDFGINVKDSSLTRYLRNPLFNYVNTNLKFSFVWEDKGFVLNYGDDFAKVVDFNAKIRNNPDVVRAILKMWTAHPLLHPNSESGTHRENVKTRMKLTFSSLHKLWKVNQLTCDPFSAFVRHSLINEAPLRATGPSILIQYKITKDMKFKTENNHGTDQTECVDSD